MKVRVRNNAEAPQGVELVGGGYRFIQPGKEREMNAANPSLLYKLDFLEVEALEAQVPEIPAKLAAKVAPKTTARTASLDHDGDGKPGGSVKGHHSTRAKGARRRRRKAAPK